jgi:hypothetical protein
MAKGARWEWTGSGVRVRFDGERLVSNLEPPGWRLGKRLASEGRG